MLNLLSEKLSIFFYCSNDQFAILWIFRIWGRPWDGWDLTWNSSLARGLELINKTKGLKLHRVIHLSTHVYLSTKVTYLSYHSLRLLLYHIYLSAKVTYLSYHSLHLLLYHIYLSTKVTYLSILPFAPSHISYIIYLNIP